MARSNLIPLLLIGGIAVAAFIFWNPSICSQLNTIGGTGFDFCSFKHTGDLDHPFPVTVPVGYKHHFHHGPHPSSAVAPVPADRSHAHHPHSGLHDGTLNLLPPAKAALAEMVDYRMSI